MFFLPDNRLCARIPSGSLQVDVRARVRWKYGDSSLNVQLSVRRWLPPFGRNLHRKNAKKQLRHPTSGSHNFSVRTPICANFISLESRCRELSDDMLHDPRGNCTNLRRMVTRRAPWSHARHLASLINKAIPPHFEHKFAQL